jgi:hypothetical protein
MWGEMLSQMLGLGGFVVFLLLLGGVDVAIKNRRERRRLALRAAAMRRHPAGKRERIAL